jgi:hypothetical protein
MKRKTARELMMRILYIIGTNYKATKASVCESVEGGLRGSSMR